MSYIRFTFCILIFCCSAEVSSQIYEDSILQLEEVVIDVNRLTQFTSGNKVQNIDSAVLKNFTSTNLGELLSQHSHSFIKTYGPGNLATISLRGTNAYQTPVLWNGFNLQGPTLGQTDFSLLPVSFADEVKIQYGGAGALFGSGAVGGVIHLNSPVAFNEGVDVGLSATAGSFSSFFQEIHAKISRQKWVSSLKFFNSNAKNDFPFVNIAQAGSPKVKQINAAAFQRGILFENHYRINLKHQINLRIWLQENDRQIPPIMTNAVSEASLGSKFLRLTSEWKRTGTRISYSARTGFFKETMVYEDPLSGQYSKTNFHTSITEAESNVCLFKNHLLNVGINNTFNYAISDGYPKGVDQNRSALFASYQISNEKRTWKTSLSMRQELVTGKLLPFIPSLGLEARIVKNVSMLGSISRNYRLPTFNDLYWQPGGNPHLKPESGWNQEITLAYSPVLNSFKRNKICLTFFNSNLTDYIMWLPSGTGNIWSAGNIQSVWSRGLESTLDVSRNFGDVTIDFSMMYSYVVSTNEKSKSANDESLNKQVIYVPIYSAQANLVLGFKKIHLSYLQTFTGNRFTSSDNKEYIQGYLLGNLILSRSFVWNSITLTCNAKVNNLFNTPYQVVLWQAMPLRNYQVGVALTLNKPTNL